MAEACQLFRQSADLNDLTFISWFIHATAVDQELFDIAGMILLRGDLFGSRPPRRGGPKFALMVPICPWVYSVMT